MKLQVVAYRTGPFYGQTTKQLPPEGSYLAVVVDIKDQVGVRLTKWQSTEEEVVDLTCFLFEFQDSRGITHRVATQEMKISTHEKSNLMKFLTGFLGQPPKMGWDYVGLKGHQCMVRIRHVPRRTGVGHFASIAAVWPASVTDTEQGSAPTFGGQKATPGSTPSLTASALPVGRPSVVSADGELPI